MTPSPFFLREIPAHVLEGVLEGKYKVTGSVVRDLATGQGVAFLQETQALPRMIDAAAQTAGIGLQSGFNPLGMAINTFQNTQITSQLNRIEESLGHMQHLQIGSLVLSGLNLGVSVAGFEMMRRKLNQISDQMNVIEQKIDQVTEDRRDDDLRNILTDIKTYLQQVDALSARSKKVNVAENVEHELERSAGRLKQHFNTRLTAMQKKRVTTDDFEMLWTILGAIKLCHDACLRALFTIDEVEAVKELCHRHSRMGLEIGAGLSSDTLATLNTQWVDNFDDYVEERSILLPYARALVDGVRGNVSAISAQSELTQHLIDHQVSGADYLNEIANENTAPLLIRELK